MNNSLQALLFLIRTLGDLYVLAFLLRFLLQWVRADFYNPLAQVIVRVTTPLIRPARRLIPSAGNVDLPTLVVLATIWALSYYEIYKSHRALARESEAAVAPELIEGYEPGHASARGPLLRLVGCDRVWVPKK